MDYMLGYLTAGTEAEAVKIIEHLLEKNLIACGNLFSEGKSVFVWEGKVQKEKEYYFIIKTKKENIFRVEDEVKKVHSYQIPCILWLSISSGEKRYLDWMDEII